MELGSWALNIIIKCGLIVALFVGVGQLTGRQAHSAVPGGASANAGNSAEKLQRLLLSELSRRYPGARVEFRGNIRLLGCELPASIDSIQVQNENARAEADFMIASSEGAPPCRGWLAFSAHIPVKTAQKRLQPGERLSESNFVRRELDIATGQGREYRGVLVPADMELSKLETRQTILEGQFLVSTAVQKIPDVRRGEAVRVQIVSAGLTLSTLGSALEPAYLDGPVRIITQKTKRELIGRLLTDGVVEVKL